MSFFFRSGFLVSGSRGSAITRLLITLHSAFTRSLILAIDMLPERTRHAMLTGVRDNDIIVGAYTDKEGRICPMLAAHRNGGRTNFISFARAWDRFAGSKREKMKELLSRLAFMPGFVAPNDLEQLVHSLAVLALQVLPLSILWSAPGCPVAVRHRALPSPRAAASERFQVASPTWSTTMCAPPPVSSLTAATTSSVS